MGCMGCCAEVKQVSASMSKTQWDALCRSAIFRSVKALFYCHIVQIPIRTVVHSHVQKSKQSISTGVPWMNDPCGVQLRIQITFKLRSMKYHILTLRRIPSNMHGKTMV